MRQRPSLMHYRGGMNQLHRLDGPLSYRLMAVDLHDGQWIGQTAGGNTLRDDIAAYQRPGCKPLYAVFVQPATSAEGIATNSDTAAALGGERA